MGTTTIYKYDDYGNITQKLIADYTPDDDEDVHTVYNFSHFNGRLESYRGLRCAYDDIGNPITYLGKYAKWNCRQLTEFDGTKFTYDGRGRRTKKGNITFTYDCEGNLIKQKNTATLEELEFFYDSQGVAGFKYGGTAYFYKKDMLGDVIALIDDNGNTVANYVYNAWGEHKIFDGKWKALTSGVAILNPFRYRSYYYDTETGFYYLQTRYYDPVTCRFLNMDEIDYADPSRLGGLNLYTYCNNDPVNYIDPTGCIEILNSLVVDIISASFDIGIGTGLAIGGWAIKTGVRPNNIGVGVFNKYKAQRIDNLSKASDVLSGVSTALAVISVVLTVADGINTDIERGYTPDRIISNVATNTAVYGGLTLGIGFLSAKIGAAIGSVVPGLGNAVGGAVGFAIGTLAGLLLEIKVNDKSIIDHIRDWVYNNFWLGAGLVN